MATYINAKSILSFIHLEYKLACFDFNGLINIVSMLGNVQEIDGNCRDEEADIAILKSIINKLNVKIVMVGIILMDYCTSLWLLLY